MEAAATSVERTSNRLHDHEPGAFGRRRIDVPRRYMTTRGKKVRTHIAQQRHGRILRGGTLTSVHRIESARWRTVAAAEARRGRRTKMQHHAAAHQK